VVVGTQNTVPYCQKHTPTDFVLLTVSFFCVLKFMGYFIVKKSGVGGIGGIKTFVFALRQSYVFL